MTDTPSPDIDPVALEADDEVRRFVAAVELVEAAGWIVSHPTALPKAAKAEGVTAYLSMWADVVVDDDGQTMFRCSEADNRDGAHDMSTVELTATNFPVGTRVEITEPREAALSQPGAPKQ